MFIVWGCAKVEEPVVQLTEDAPMPVTDTQVDEAAKGSIGTKDEESFEQPVEEPTARPTVLQASEVAQDLFGTWASEVTRNEHWEPKPLIVSHYSDLAHASEGATEVYVLNHDRSFQRTVSDPDYHGEGLAESIMWGDWLIEGHEIRLRMTKHRLTVHGEIISDLDWDRYNEYAPENGLEPWEYYLMFFRLSEDRRTFVSKRSDRLYEDGLDILFRKQPLED